MLRVESTLPSELEELVSRIIGAAIEVHRHLGPGFIESIYETALCHEFGLVKLNYERQKKIPVTYKGVLIEGQRLDLVVEGKVILELKAVDSFGPIHHAQLLSYLKAANLRVGLLINFKEYQLKRGLKRVVL